MYWHGHTVSVLRENTIQTLVGTMAAIMTGCLGLCSAKDIEHAHALKRRGQHTLEARYVSIVAMTVVLCLLGVIPETKNVRSFMLTLPASKLFFWSRPVSAAFCLYAAAGFLSTAKIKKGGIRTRRVFCQSRDAAMLGGIAFIGGEICGSYWSLLGWGSTWRWSGNFFGSAAMFLLLMVGMHVPSKLLGRRVHRPLLCGVIYLVAGVSVIFGKLG